MAKEIYTFDPEMDYNEYTIVFEYTNGYNIVTYTTWNENKGKMETDFIPRQGRFEFTRDQQLSHKSIAYKSLNAAQKFLKERGAVVEAPQEQAPQVETEEPAIVSTPKTPKPFVIREEAAYPRGSYFRVYYADMTPLYMGEKTVEAVEARLRRRELVSSIEVIYLNESTTPKEVAPVTVETTVYEKNGKTYCESCKPKNGKKSTLVLSSPDRVFCSGCGNDLYGDDDLSPSDLAAIEHAVSQPDLGPYTMAELEAMAEQAHANRCPSCNTDTLIKGCYGCGERVCVYCGHMKGVQWFCSQCWYNGYEKPYHERLQHVPSYTARFVAEVEGDEVPCAWCGTSVSVGVEQDGKRYCDEECALWDAALSCGIVPGAHAATAGFDTNVPY